MEDHRASVAAVAARVRYFYDRKEPFRIFHGHASFTKTTNFRRDQIVDTSKLNHIIQVNRSRRTALVEPSVSMEELVSFTTKTGLLPKIVPGFRHITVGGAFAGSSGDSSSFKHGYFEDTVREIEIILANGDLKRASRSQDPDLLDAAAGSFGTLGVVTLLEIELQPAARYVKLDFLKLDSTGEVVTEIEDATKDLVSNDYVDGVLFGQDKGIVMVGQMTAKTGGLETLSFTNARDDWFYTFIDSRLKNGDQSRLSITVPLVDYLFRFERGAFWTGKHTCEYFCIPFNRFTRYLLDSFMKSTVIHRVMHESGLAESYISHHIGLPSSRVSSYTEYIFEEFSFSPLWLCPLKKGHRLPLHARTNSPEGNQALSSETVINVGAWGPGPKAHLEVIKANRKIEVKSRNLWGGKCFGTRVYHTEEEFWEIYDQKRHEEIREKYDAKTLHNIYEKMRADLNLEAVAGSDPYQRSGLSYLLSLFWSIWPIAGLYGVIVTLLSAFLPELKESVPET